MLSFVLPAKCPEVRVRSLHNEIVVLNEVLQGARASPLVVEAQEGELLRAAVSHSSANALTSVILYPDSGDEREVRAFINTPIPLRAVQPSFVQGLLNSLAGSKGI